MTEAGDTLTLATVPTLNGLLTKSGNGTLGVASLPTANVAVAAGTLAVSSTSTITLATDTNAVGTWAGSTVGMVFADALAIWVGKALGERLPEKAIRIGASVAFFAFGALMLVDALS